MTTSTATRGTLDGIAHGWAVRVRYLGPTNYRGSRWIATADHSIGRATVSYSYEIGHGAENAAQAADELARRWTADYATRYPDAPARPHRIIAYGHNADGSYSFIVDAVGG